MGEPSLKVETEDASLESTANFTSSHTNLHNGTDSSATDVNQPTLISVEKQDEPIGEQSDPAQTVDEKRSSVTHQMPVHHTEVYSCQTDLQLPQSVQQLRDYYSGLDEAAKTGQKGELHSSTVQNRKTSYTLSVSAIPSELKKDVEETKTYGVKSEHNSRSPSVEELRRLFESLPDTRLSKENKLKRFDSSCEPLSRSEDTTVIASKSVEFYSRPPNVRSHSPQIKQLPTPPPLPLPATNMSNCENYVCSHYYPPKRAPPKSQIELVVKPKSSKHLPFRSRSLALEQSRNNSQCQARDSRGHRYRRRQISASPIRFRGYTCDTGCQTPTASSIAYTSRDTNQYGQRLISMAEQTPYRSISAVTPASVPKNENSPVITGPDGVYIRSAVVYERVPDSSETEIERRFVTTYIISNDTNPSPSTVQATNLWVAERSLMPGKQQLTLPPHRTQTLSPVRFNTLPRFTSEQTRKQADGRYTAINVEQEPYNSNFKKEQERTQQTEMYSSLQADEWDNSLKRRPYTNSLPGAYRRGRQRQRRNQAGMYRTWSVKSLSPPPFRSQWLSTWSNPKLNQLVQTDEVLSPDPQCYPRPSELPNDNDRHRELGIPELDRQRQQEARDRRAWLRRAEILGRKRLNFHHFRGSWSPPHHRSPPRDTPNNVEEPTEDEIRHYIRHNLPIPVVPREPPTHDQAVQTRCLEKAPFKRHAVTQVNRFQSDIDESPITENFDEKCTFFEDLIRTNKMLAQCSFCSDCYHCAPKRCSNHSSYASWASDLQVQNYHNNQESIKMNQPVYHSSQRPLYVHKNDKNCRTNRSDDMWNFQDIKCGVLPHESVYTSQESPTSFYPTSQFRRKCTHEINHSKCSSNSIDYDYYAKPHVQMPKVAPNPPAYHSSGWSRVSRSYGYPPQAELIRSPMPGTDYPSPTVERENHRFIHSGSMHSKPYVLNNGSGQLCQSYESLYGDQLYGTDATYYGRGKVKLMASQLDNLISHSYGPDYGD